MKNVCIVSFGNSTKYKVTIEKTCLELSQLRAEIREYLENKFPQIKALNFYDQMTVVPLTDENRADYAGYEEFSAASIPEIEKVLSTEVEDENSLTVLNSNDAFGGTNINAI